MNYYELLEISKTATEDEIKKGPTNDNIGKLIDAHKELIASYERNIILLSTKKSGNDHEKKDLQKIIEDNNERNPLINFRYVFSTGEFIDSLYIKGNISDAYNREISKNINTPITIV